MARSKNGQAIGPTRLTKRELAKLDALLEEARGSGDLATFRRAVAVKGYIDGRRVIDLAETLKVTRGAINRWLGWYEALGAKGLRTAKAPGPEPRLSDAQREEVAALVEAGPQAAGFATGVWTGPMIRDVIARRFGVTYHTHYIPPLLHQLGFSVQRPRKRLARADAEAQAYWLRKRLPAIKKKPTLAADS